MSPERLKFLCQKTCTAQNLQCGNSVLLSLPLSCFRWGSSLNKLW
ncbi:MAG: DUF3079 domain-containing protein [Chryseobacterium sp.]|nr:DUF3079 domain-containing protein [Chryseobacterium sp.]